MAKINRRSFMQTTAATGVALAAPAYLKHASAQDGKEVNIWTYANFVPDDFKAAFEQETGIKVNIRLVDDQGKQFNLLAAEAPNPTADIVTVAGHRFLQFIDSGLLAPMDTGRLGNWGNINPVYSESDWATINGEQMGCSHPLRRRGARLQHRGGDAGGGIEWGRDVSTKNTAARSPISSRT